MIILGPLYSTLVIDFGAFVQIPGFRKHGLVHKTQASKHFLEHISDMVAVEDSVWVKTTTNRKRRSLDVV
jgi:predicted RNA-binding protein with RPS1 domain